MKTVAENYALTSSDTRSTMDGSFDSSMLGRIGDNLRDLYNEVTDSEQPRSLLALAEAIDARLGGNAPGE